MRKYCCGIVMLAVLGCSDTTAPEPPWDLEVRVTPAAAAPFAGRSFAVALVDLATDDIIARNTVTLNAGGVTFVFADVLDFGLSHELLYWIDDNNGGGAPGACDTPAIDPQGVVFIDPAPTDLWVEFTNLRATGSEACYGFTADLIVEGAAAFGADHAGDDIVVRLIDTATGAVRGQHLGQIAATGVPFSFAFDGLLVVGRSYQLEVWVDSNIDGGAPGVCDDLPVDRQWRIMLGTAGEENMLYTLPLDTAAMTDVCPISI